MIHDSNLIRRGAGVVVLAAAVFATTAPARGQLEPGFADRITRQLQSADAAEAAKAFEEVRGKSKNPALRLALYDRWVPALMSAHRYDEAIELAQGGILAQAWDLTCLESLQRAKVRSLLIIGKYQEALAEAKSYFNVCGMPATKDALNLLDECLAAAHPDDVSVVERFRQEQTQGAVPSATEPSQLLRSSVMDAITIDPKLYEEAAAALPAEGFRWHMARAHLFLLAGKPQEARKCFQDAMAAPDRSGAGAAALSGPARSMKAEDGTIGRANALIVQLAPKTPAEARP